MVAALKRPNPVDRIISLAGGVWLSRFEPNPARWLLKRAVFEGWYAITELVGYCPAARVGFGTDDEPTPYVRQFVVNARRDAWLSADASFDYLDGMRRIRCPILSVVGSADHLMCHPVAAREWLIHAQRAAVSHRLVGGQAGDPTNVGHMDLVTRGDMQKIWTECGDWALTGAPI